jgi:hypothetical protein
MPFEGNPDREMATSANGETGVLPQLARMPGQHDVLLWYSCCHQLVGNGPVRPVVLNPHLVTDDIDVDHRTVNALDAIPADVQQLKMVTLGIHNQFGINLAIGWFAMCVFRENLPYDLTVFV